MDNQMNMKNRTWSTTLSVDLFKTTFEQCIKSIRKREPQCLHKTWALSLRADQQIWRLYCNWNLIPFKSPCKLGFMLKCPSGNVENAGSVKLWKPLTSTLYSQACCLYWWIIMIHSWLTMKDQCFGSDQFGWVRPNQWELTHSLFYEPPTLYNFWSWWIGKNIQNNPSISATSLILQCEIMIQGLS